MFFFFFSFSCLSPTMHHKRCWYRGVFVQPWDRHLLLLGAEPTSPSGASGDWSHHRGEHASDPAAHRHGHSTLQHPRHQEAWKVLKIYRKTSSDWLAAAGGTWWIQWFNGALPHISISSCFNFTVLVELWGWNHQAMQPDLPRKFYGMDPTVNSKIDSGTRVEDVRPQTWGIYSGSKSCIEVWLWMWDVLEDSPKSHNRLHCFAHVFSFDVCLSGNQDTSPRISLPWTILQSLPTAALPVSPQRIRMRDSSQPAARSTACGSSRQATWMHQVMDGSSMKFL